MATVKALLRTGKLNNKGEAPVYLRVTQDRKTTFKSLQISIPPEFWDDPQGQIKKNNKIKGYVRLNNYISNEVVKLRNKLLDEETKSSTITTSKIKEIVADKPIIDFFEYGDQYLSRIANSSQVRVHTQTKTILNKLESFQKKRFLNFEDMTVSYLKNYQVYLRDVYKNQPNTIFTNLKILRKLFYLAIQEDIISADINPFRKIKFKWEATEIDYLTDKELSKVAELEIDPTIKRYHIRNIYIFAVYVGGLRISDILMLKWENLVNEERIDVFTQKTRTNVSIMLTPTALRILAIYDKADKRSSDFIFPFLENGIDYSNPKFLYKRISSLTAYTNTNLKQIAKDAKIEKALHFHTSRHTFACRGLSKGMNIVHISKLMGHSSVKMTENYAKVINKDLDNAMKLFE